MVAEVGVALRMSHIGSAADRPTAAELNEARALIARVKAADSSIKKADESQPSSSVLASFKHPLHQ